MRYSIVHDTRTGARSNNQDRVAFSENQNGIFMVVADGMGGHARGDAAAQITVDCLIESFNYQGQSRIDDPAAFIVLSMNFAHLSVNRMTRMEGLDDNMPRTTCVACLVQNGYAYWGHVGDSRLYMFGDGELLSRTVDHTTTDQLHQDSAVDEHFQRFGQGQVFRCIGGNKRPVVSLGAETHLGQGDTILLCTDGVWRAFRDDQLLAYVNKDNLEVAVEDMLAFAQRCFAHKCDNLTALMFRWEDEPTRHEPLFNLGAPQLDQEKLWHSPGSGNFASKTYTGRDKRRSENIDAAIAEIESFVNELDSVYDLPPDRAKNT
jgi:serine/threonine protein phosphatase PrpC